jgi:hypothetical protein
MAPLDARAAGALRRDVGPYGGGAIGRTMHERTAAAGRCFPKEAEVMLMIADRAAFSVRRLGKDLTIAGLAFAYSLWSIAGSGYQVVFRGFLLLMAGIPVYLYMRWRAASRPELVEVPAEVRAKRAEEPPATDLGLSA